MSMKPKVVVGVDGSEPARAALRWAAREADVRQTELVAVMAWDLLDQRPADRSTPFDPHFDDDAAAAELARSLADVLEPEALARVEQVVECAKPAPAILGVAGPGDLVVVGSRGLGGFKGLLLGSVSEQVVDHASGPVVVVPEDRPQQDGRIVVGVDGSEASVLALTWAAAEAKRWGGSVEAVSVWSYPYASALPFGPMPDPSIMEEGAHASLTSAILDACPDGGADVEAVLVQGQPARVLRDRAEGASMLVMGSRGRGGFKGLLLGSVSSQCVHHAPCPTVVVRNQA